MGTLSAAARTPPLGPVAGRRREPGDRLETHGVRHTVLDISSELQVHSLRANLPAPCCAACNRRPLPGERVHVYETGATLCALCAAAEPEAPIRSDRVLATHRPLAVVPRAA